VPRYYPLPEKRQSPWPTLLVLGVKNRAGRLSGGDVDDARRQGRVSVGWASRDTEGRDHEVINPTSQGIAGCGTASARAYPRHEMKSDR